MAIRIINTDELTGKQLDYLQIWKSVDNKFTKFEMNADKKLFELLFGEDGERLEKIFHYQCGGNFESFEDHLTVEEKNILYANIVYNDQLYSES